MNEDPTPTAAPQVAPEEVADFLKTTEQVPDAEKPAPAGSVSSFELPPEALDFVKQRGQTQKTGDGPSQEETQRIEIPGSPHLHADMPVLAPPDPWSRTDVYLGKVSVNTLERKAYWSASLIEEGIEFEAVVHGVSIWVRDVSGFELDVINKATARDQIENGLRYTMDQLNARRAIYDMVMQIKLINGVEPQHFTQFEDEKLDIDSAVTVLRANAEEFRKTLRPPRHSLLLTALRVFDLKNSICHTGLANEDFLGPASMP